MTAYGIDFGTTNCVLAQTTRGKERVLSPDSAGRTSDWMFPGFQHLVPSVFGVVGRGADQTDLFGWAAKLRAEERVEAVKRVIADHRTFELAGRVWSTEQVATALFRVLREGAAADGGKMESAVVTVPANSTGRARLMTRRAAGLAGISVAALLNEPTAAAMAFAEGAPDVGRILVYDFGGGTLDVTVLDVVDGVFRERASKGIAGLGGLDLDIALRELAFLQITGHEEWTPAERRLFQLEIERTKVRLSTENVVVIYSPDGTQAAEITRPDFETVIGAFVDKSLEPVRRCISDLAMGPDDVDALLLIGGSSQVPLVRRRVQELIGREAVPVGRCDPLSAVARGAAVAAGILSGERDDLDFCVVTEHALGTLSTDVATGRRKFSTIIPRNRLLPASEARSYRTKNQGTPRICLTVVEGDPDLAPGDDRNVVLKSFDIALDAQPDQQVTFDVEFRYDVWGVVHVDVHERSTGKQLLSGEVSWLDDAETERRKSAEIEEVESLFGEGVAHLTPGDLAAAPEHSWSNSSSADGRQAPATKPTTSDREPPVLVVDGSNLACAGRAVSDGVEAPSLAQLREAVRALREQYPSAVIKVVVDANFGHVILETEQADFRAALVDKFLLQTPAGTAGAGDVIVCAVAERLHGTVVTNDSYKELQERHGWLFDGRLLGALCVDGQWIFEPRTPVRAKRTGLFRRPRQIPIIDDATIEQVAAGPSLPAAKPAAAPPVPRQRVFVSSSQGRYHRDDQCGALRVGRAKAITDGMHVGRLRELDLPEARLAGHVACQRCG